MSAEVSHHCRIGYCTNVHAGRTLAETKAQLQKHATAIRNLVAPQDRLNIGLWLSADAAAELDSPAAITSFRDWLDAHYLRIFTINGFPYGDFHGPVVKHRVYEPSWADERRLGFTLSLARILVALVDEGEHAGISTLPLGWPAPPCNPVDHATAVMQLRTTARELNRLAAETGRLIHLDIEPEPGCILSTSGQLCNFYLNHLLRDVSEAEERIIRRHIRVCHDVCHAAVMFESQYEALDRYSAAGIAIGKVQVSSAIDIRVPADERQRRRVLDALHPFAEDRYLHQTGIMRNGEQLFLEDLPAALSQTPTAHEEHWRIHYHVPISRAHIGSLGTTQSAITECLQHLPTHGARDLEIETYTWGVLPEPQRPPSIASGIAGEIEWLRAELARLDIACEGPT